MLGYVNSAALGRYFAAPFASAHRFRVAAMIRFRPAALIFLLAFVGVRMMVA